MKRKILLLLTLVAIVAFIGSTGPTEPQPRPMNELDRIVDQLETEVLRLELLLKGYQRVLYAN